MTIDITATSKTWYTARRKLPLEAPDIAALKSRGVYWRPDCDDVAYEAARPFFDEATRAIRARAKNPELPVELGVYFEDGALVAECRSTIWD